ncbi:MAG: hypothetical protein CVU39_02990 [Chloroflexi bacterium HGW-Chloroflexi-10]|nr:MAG: hypothetical protein CVU39_02990 [Chloroflexi bacterium HGW-Chloroflexi-10]
MMKNIALYKYCFLTKKCTQLPLPENINNIDDLVISLSSGVYTTIRIYKQSKVLYFQAHLGRLKDSLALSGISIGYGLNDIRKPIRDIVTKFCEQDLRIRIHIPLEYPDVCYLIQEFLSPYPESIYATGVKVKTNQLSRENPKAKLTEFISASIKEKECMKRLGLEESLIIGPNQEILEGLTSNFFGIKGDDVYTAMEMVLDGITRSIVLRIIQESGFHTVLKPVNFNDINFLDECFITSTSRGVLPVIQIDDIHIGNGLPGKKTMQIRKEFLALINSELEFI